MPIFTPNKPQPGDNPSQSQDVLLQDFLTLQDMYGETGDHYPWTNQTSVEGKKHAKVTMPGLPTTNRPGDALPQPATGNCAMFAITRDNQTTPFLARDALVPDKGPPTVNLWPMVPIKAYITFVNTSGTTVTVFDSFNLGTPVVTNPVVATTIYTIPFVNNTRTLNPGVMIFINQPFGGGSQMVLVSSITAGSPNSLLLTSTIAYSSFRFNVPITVIVLES